MDNQFSDEQQPQAEFEALLEASFSYKPPVRGEIRSATILQVRRNEIIVDLGAKQDGIVPSQDLDRMDEEFRATLLEGLEVPVYVMNPHDADGNIVVSINMGLQKHDWDKAKILLESEEVVHVNVTGHNRGGVLVRWNRLEGFIPTSHMVSVSPGLTGNDRRETLIHMEGEELGVKVIEVDPNRRRLIFSEREAQKEWRAQQKARLLAELNEGQIVSGTVTGLRDFGAFVNLGGADGLIHVSELAWHRVDHPRDVLSVGDEIDVYVLSLDRNTNRIALSRKRLLPDPWSVAMERYHEGQQVAGVVTNVVDFGAFIALDDGLEGLLHLSEMGDGSLKEPHSYVKKGDHLDLCISHLEPERRRVGFTQRWGVQISEEAPTADADSPEAEEGETVAVEADETGAPGAEEAGDADETGSEEVISDAAASLDEDSPPIEADASLAEAESEVEGEELAAETVVEPDAEPDQVETESVE